MSEIEFPRTPPNLPPYEGRNLRLRPLSEVPPRNVRWLVPGLVPRRALTLTAGVGGLGKSTWSSGVAARTSRGDLLGEPADVIVVSFEDAAEEILRPRIEAAGGDLSRIHEIVDDGIGSLDPVQLPRDLAALEWLVHEVRARLVVIDPIVAAIDTALDAHKDQHVRSVLGRLRMIAEEADCAIVLIGHLNKTPSKDAYVRVANSTAFWNASRSVVLVTEDPEDPDEGRLVVQRKANYARLRPVERHRIEEIVLEGTLDVETGAPMVTSRMTFIEHAPDVDAADVLAPRTEARDTTKELAAARFLLAALGDGAWHESRPIKERAEAEGVAKRTLQRAFRDLGGKDKREGFPAVTYWRIPSCAAGSPSTCGAAGERPGTPHRERKSETPAVSVAPATPGENEAGASAGSGGFERSENERERGRQNTEIAALGPDEARDANGDQALERLRAEGGERISVTTTRAVEIARAHEEELL